ncbi:MAG: cytochrome c oxidase assembly protein [Burkholderiaceae bacterium]
MSDALARTTARPAGPRPRLRAVALLAPAGWLAAMAAVFGLADAGGFTGHMAIHLLNITLVAPLAALATRGHRPAWLPAPVVAAFIELLAVWAWHAPSAHAFARASIGGFLLEQASFVAGAWLLWATVIDAALQRDRSAMAQSVLALLLTSMHMTLLGGVLALAGRDPYGAGLCGSATTGLDAMADLQLGGVLMLGVAATVYLIAALRLASMLLERHRA